ncbi:MAG: hypothetical protein ACRDYA_20455 [Egibacteraceae bacterium]
MRRRDVLEFLATGVLLPIGEMGFLRGDGAPPRIGAATLDSLEANVTALATYHTSSPRVLLPGTLTYLDQAYGLLDASMRADQRVRLQSILADIAIFSGHSSFNLGQKGRAGAYLTFAERHAREAGNLPLVAQALGGQALLSATVLTGGRSGDPQASVKLLRQAVELADRHAAQVMRAWLHAFLATEYATAGDAYQADVHMDLAARALQAVQAEGPMGSGFSSTAGVYAGWRDAADLDRFKGAAEMAAGRSVQAAQTLTRVYKGLTTLRKRVDVLTDLSAVRLAQKHPEEVARLLGEAHTLGVEHDYTMGIQRVLGVRGRVPKDIAGLACMRTLDDQLRSLG